MFSLKVWGLGFMAGLGPAGAVGQFIHLQAVGVTGVLSSYSSALYNVVSNADNKKLVII
jgi:hypothetical protein